MSFIFSFFITTYDASEFVKWSSSIFVTMQNYTHVFLKNLTMADTLTSQNIELSFWITVCNEYLI
jgi:hypothetical protein